jgi:F-box-like
MIGMQQHLLFFLMTDSFACRNCIVQIGGFHYRACCVLQVFALLNPFDLASCMAVSRAWKNLVSADDVWRRLLSVTFPKQYLHAQDIPNWRHFALLAKGSFLFLNLSIGIQRPSARSMRLTACEMSQFFQTPCSGGDQGVAS